MDLEGLKSAAVGVGCLILGGCAGWSTWEDPDSSASGEWAPAAETQQAAGSHGQYRVRRGDTLYSIAFRHGVDFRQLARWNGIGSDYLIYPGQLLRLNPPPGGAFSPSEPTGASAASPGVPHAEVPSVSSSSPAAPTASSPVAPARPPQLPMPPMGGDRWSWPTAGKVSRGFGVEGNKGVDFTGTEGQPVFAAAPGRVVYSGNALKGYGELIIIKHDEDFLSAYGYNQARHVQEGDVVTAGQPIARMGRGPENRPLLHFEVRRAGRPVDPVQYLPRP